MSYFVLKFLHVIGASVLLGTGAGIAFFMVLAPRSRSPAIISGVARIVVVADCAFTATAVVAFCVPKTEIAARVKPIKRAPESPRKIDAGLKL